MLFSPRESLEDTIIRLLSKSKSSPGDLYKLLDAESKTVTIQAVYKALRYLIQAAVVVKSGQSIALSQEWIDTVSETLKPQFSIPVLADGESATYKYKSLVNLDGYWKHLNKAFQEQYPDYPVFLYSPYHIWYHISERSQSEADYFNAFKKQGRCAFFVIGNDSEIDRQFKKAFQNEFLQIDTWQKTPLKNTDYLTIYGDYVVHTILSRDLTRAIHQYYQSPMPSDEASQKLNNILSASNQSKIKLERNAKKAKQLRKKLFKNFYLSPQIKNKYDLF